MTTNPATKGLVEEMALAICADDVEHSVIKATTCEKACGMCKSHATVVARVLLKQMRNHKDGTAPREDCRAFSPWFLDRFAREHNLLDEEDGG